MKKFRWSRNAIIFSAVFFLAFVAYLISEGILQANMLAAAEGDQPPEYGRLVDWLPKEAKTAIEYRARYLDLKEKVEKTRDVDSHVDAMFNFADYIKQKDKKGSDKVFAEVATNPEYRKSRLAYKSLAKLLLSDNPHCTLTIKDYQDHINSLTWVEDKLAAWNAGRSQLNSKRVSPQVHLQYLAPLLEDKMIYANFDNFYGNIQTHANKLKDDKTVQLATAIRAEIKNSRRSIPNAIIQAPLDFRIKYAEYKKEIADADTPDNRLLATVGLASLLLNRDNAEASQLLVALRDNPEYVNCKNYYVLMSRMLLDKRISKQVSIEEYHNFIKSLKDDDEIFTVWEAGLAQLASIKASPAVYVAFMKPLLDKKPAYRDYLYLFEQLKEKAEAAKDAESVKKADEMIELIRNDRDMPFRNKMERTEG